MDYSFQFDSLEGYKEAYKNSVENPEQFWSKVADTFAWHKKWDKTLEWDFKTPKIEWFKGGKLNITENCLDRHLAERGNQPALIWEPNNPTHQTRTYTYKELHREVCRFANVLKNNGVQKGDRICIYMGMVPELAISLLACARLGAIHSVIFGGFSANSILDRLEDAGASFIITCDGAFRGSKVIPLKEIIDDALQTFSSIQKVIVLKHTNSPVSMVENRDIWWGDEMKKLDEKGDHFQAEIMDAEDPLYILYTSGSTGKPKGVVHSVAGYMIFTTYTFVNVFQYKPGQVFFCTADIGWVTGHSYIVYGPLSAGAISLMFEGIPTWPDAGRFWDIVDKYRVNIFYTAPTAIRSLMGFGAKPLEGKDLSSLEVLGTVGEPINIEAWEWYNQFIGKNQCPIVDTWWQTETGGILISNFAGISPSRPCWATLPLPGVQPVLINDQGKEVTEKIDGLFKGNLCMKSPWPSILRTTYGDHERFRLTYFSTYPGLYFSGDGALKDEEGNFRIIGRVDDVLNVSGHRIGTAEVENAINMCEGVVESAVVAYPHDIKGHGIYAFVILNMEKPPGQIAEEKIRDMVAEQIGHFAKPDKIQIVKGLPKTRSGKIMRRILRKIAENEVENLGDTTSLLDPEIVAEIIREKL
ncbi:MAG: acetate--CoA ligase [Bacteroidetes bacterium]|nr:acetate--CoA ligase [Bacteroidota bacterium]